MQNKFNIILIISIVILLAINAHQNKLLFFYEDKIDSAQYEIDYLKKYVDTLKKKIYDLEMQSDTTTAY